MKRRSPSQYDFLKGEVDEMLLSELLKVRRETSPRRGKVKHIDIHHMTIHDSLVGRALAACVSTWAKRQASAHYGVDNAHCAQFVYDNREAWGNANTKANQEGIVVEHANASLAPGWSISRLTMETSAKLVAGLHIIHKLGRPTSVGFGEGGTIRTHRSFYATSCPGPYFEKYWKTYVKMVQDQYDIYTKKTPSKPAPAPVTPKPSEVKSVAHIKAVHWNIADDDTVNGYKATNAQRGDEIGRYVRDMDVDLFLASEAGTASLIDDVSRILPNRWSKDDKSVWIKDKDMLIAPRKTYATSKAWSWLGRKKHGVAVFGQKGNKKWAMLEIHTDYRKDAKQAKQVRSLFAQFRKDCDKLGIKHVNQVVCMDGNWDGTSADNPFKALDSYNFEEKGNTTQATFLDGRHLDGVLGHKEAEVTVKARSRSNSDGIKLSDHYPLEFRLSLS